MDNLIGGIVPLILMLALVNAVGTIRLNGVGKIPWKETKKILAVENIIVILIFIGHYVLRLF